MSYMSLNVLKLNLMSYHVLKILFFKYLYEVEGKWRENISGKLGEKFIGENGLEGIKGFVLSQLIMLMSQMKYVFVSGTSILQSGTTLTSVYSKFNVSNRDVMMTS